MIFECFANLQHFGYFSVVERAVSAELVAYNFEQVRLVLLDILLALPHNLHLLKKESFYF